MNDYNPFSLSGKVILVTGASSGIGRSTAIECSKMGASVIVTARNEEKLKETLSLMSGNDNKYILADLSKEEEIENLVIQLPKIDGLVNNAGLNIMAPIPFINKEKTSHVFDVNLLAPILLTQKMVKNKKINKSCQQKNNIQN